MKFKNTLYLISLSSTLILSGCLVRTYPLTRERVDQNLTNGNRGYLNGQAPITEERQRKETRTTQVVEIELRSPIKFEKTAKPKEESNVQALKTGLTQEPLTLEEEQETLSNKGYLTEGASSLLPEISLTSKPTSATFNTEKYTVQKTDTLQKISQKFYGTTKKWKRIYEANKNILRGPDNIYVGQILDIPVEETKEDLK